MMPAQNPRQPGGMRWTSLVGTAIRARLLRRVPLLSNVGYWQRETARVQIEQLRGLLRKASATEFGRSHDFARLGTMQDDEIVAAPLW